MTYPIKSVAVVVRAVPSPQDNRPVYRWANPIMATATNFHDNQS